MRGAKSTGRGDHMKFIGRTQELAFLNDCYHSSKAQLVILYGRRRVGKTELLHEFAKDKPHVFSSSTEAPMRSQLKAFSSQMFAAGSPAGSYTDSYESWHDALADIGNLPLDGKKLVIIDEFPYLVKSDASLPSELQALWDSTLKSQNVMLVLCGSAMSFIEKEILSEKNPLYGRATGLLKLEPMPFWDAAEFFPDYSAEQKLLSYCILGGIPQYLEQFDAHENIENNVKQFILRKGSALYSEPEFLMRQEFRETAVYNGLLQAVALGATRLNEIAQKAMVPPQKASVYLRNLIEVNLLEREFPVETGQQERSKAHRGLYRLNDNYFRFWYAFVYCNIDALEMSDIDGVWSHDVKPELNSFAATPFERLCQDWLWKENARGSLPIRCAKVGRWWNSTDEIDVLGIDKGDNNAIAGECKFRDSPVGTRVLGKLMAKTDTIKPEVVQHLLFSKSGFTDNLKSRASDQVRLIAPENLYE